jgi:hypothetical protein
MLKAVVSGFLAAVFGFLIVFSLLLTWEHQLSLEAVEYRECGGVWCEAKER